MRYRIEFKKQSYFYKIQSTLADNSLLRTEAKSLTETKKKQLSLLGNRPRQKPIIGSVQLPHIPVTAFLQPDLFFLNLPQIQTPAGTSVTNHKRGPNF